MASAVWIVAGFFAWAAYSIWADKIRLRDKERNQQPALQDDEATWTDLDQVAMSIARHEVLAEWHEQGRNLFREIPKRDWNFEGGYDTCPDEYGDAISEHYGRVFREIRAQSERKREERLMAAKARSVSARAAFEVKLGEISRAFGQPLSVPSWHQD